MSVGNETTQIEDTELLHRMRSGDSSAFDVLYSRYYDLTIERAMAVLGSMDLAREISQESFLKLLRKPPLSVSKPGGLGGWLNRVARNCAIDHQRKLRHELVESPVDVSEIPSDSNPLQGILEIEDNLLIQRLLERLTPEYLQLIRLRFYENCTFAVMAERCGIPIGTALWRLNHAIEVLQGYYREENE